MVDSKERLSTDLPTDLIYDVLSRLPVKSLIRFKSVCKTWYALIENPGFVDTHTKMQPNIEIEPTINNMIVTSKGPGNTKRCNLLHFSETSHTLIDWELSYLSCREDCVVVGVCNGLVCVGLSFNSPEFIICNPAIGQFRQTSKFKLPKREDSLIFLGFCLHVNDYEVIRIVYMSTSSYSIPVIQVELYTMCTDTWREVDVKLGQHFWLGDLGWRGHEPHDYPEAVVIDGVFYWKAQSLDGGPYVAYFDKCKNVFDVIEGPGVAYDALGWQIREIKEELSLVIYQCYNMFELWVLNEGKYWTMMHEIDLSLIPSYPEKWESKIRVLGSTRNGELVLVNWYEDKLRLSLYDLKSEEIKCLHDVGFERYIDDAYLYTESLTPVNQI